MLFSANCDPDDPDDPDDHLVMVFGKKMKYCQQLAEAGAAASEPQGFTSLEFKCASFT